MGIMKPLKEWKEYIKFADKCISLAPGICKGIESKGIALEKIHIIPNASDLKLFKPLEINRKKRPELLPEIGKNLDKDSFIAAFAGAHGIANGLEALLEVAVELKRRKRNEEIKFGMLVASVIAGVSVVFLLIVLAVFS